MLLFKEEIDSENNFFSVSGSLNFKRVIIFSFISFPHINIG